MITVIALTQFVFLTLGIATLKIMIQAQTIVTPRLQAWDAVALWLFAVPLVWIAFASICQHIDRGPLTTGVARASGIVLAILSFGFLASVTFLLS